MGVAHTDDPVFRHQHERVGAPHLADGLGDRRLDVGGFRPREQVHHDFAVGAGLEDCAFVDERITQLAGVDQIAVVPQRQLAVRAVDHDGLGVGQPALPGGGVAHVTNGEMAGQAGQRLVVEGVVDVAHRA